MKFQKILLSGIDTGTLPIEELKLFIRFYILDSSSSLEDVILKMSKKNK